jgi:UV DNA damage endonuclease
VKKSKTGASKDAPVFLQAGPVRWGLCCQFLDAPIRFRTATHRYCATLEPSARAQYLSAIVLANAIALRDAIVHCSELGIGAFRITSQIVPLATHPVSGYDIDNLPDAEAIHAALSEARSLSKTRDVRLSFHPDQFVVLNSETETTVTSSVREMEHHARIAKLVDAEALTLHAGGGAGGEASALARLARGVDKLSPQARARLALENDDRSFSPAALLPFCEKEQIAFVYDVHHHRCHRDRMPVAEASERAAATWNGREPWMHVSSPREGWSSTNPRSHAEFIDAADLPEEWMGKRMTIDVEAKAKERAVLDIMRTAWKGDRA